MPIGVKKSKNQLEKEVRDKKRNQELLEEKHKIQQFLIEKELNDTKEYNVRKALLNETLKTVESKKNKIILNKNYYIPFTKYHADIKKDFIKKDENRNRLEKWTRFKNCSKIPLVDNIPELREFLFKWNLRISSNQAKRINWYLKCDEHSFLCQDVDKVFTTFDRVKEQQPNIGNEYLEMMKELLTILDDIDNIISSVNPEIISIKDDIRQSLKNCIDLFTHNILSNVDRDMKHIDAHSAEFYYKSDIFSLEIWTLRDVPQIAKTWKEIFTQTINFKDVEIVCPENMKFEKNCFRSIWIKYDHFSDSAPSFNNSKLTNFFVDLKTSNDIEWEKRLELKEKSIKIMKEKRLQWEENQQLTTELLVEKEQLPRKKETADNTQTKKKSKKAIKEPEIEEPIIVNENTAVDCEEDFLMYDNEIYDNLNESIGPNSLNLKKHEINLRKYKILGGVYSFDYLNRPIQTINSGPNQSLKLESLPNVLEFREYSETEGNKLVYIKMKLPETVYWWQAPIPCRWEPWEESDEFFSLKRKIQNFHLNYKEIMSDFSKKLFKSPNIPVDYKKLTEIQDFDLTNFPNQINVQNFLKKHLAPRLTDNYRFPSELLVEIEKQKKIQKMLMEIKLEDDQENTESVISEIKHEVEVTPPRILFPTKNQFFPISITQKNAKKIHFDVPCTDPRYLVKLPNDILEDDPLFVSEFLSHLEKLRDEEVPKFNNGCTVKEEDIKPENIEFCKIEGSLQSISETPFRKGSRFSSRKSFMREVEPQITETAPSVVPDISVKPQRKKIIYDLVPHSTGKWTSKDVYSQEFDAETNTLSFKIGKLGFFGFALPKYHNLPFKNWEIFPNKEKRNTVELILTGTSIKLSIQITESGYFLKVFEPEIPKISSSTDCLSLKELILTLRTAGMDIFPERDSVCYIENHTEKHISMEMHSYSCMGLFALTHHFRRSAWNKLSHRRIAIFLSREVTDGITLKEFAEVMVTPQKTAFVETDELCTASLDDVQLEYNLVPMDQEFQPDLAYLLKQFSAEPSKRKQESTKLLLRWNVSKLLSEIRPFSFS